MLFRASPGVMRFRHVPPGLSVESLALAASLFFSVFSNVAFWRAVAATGALHGAERMADRRLSLFIAITALNMLLLCGAAQSLDRQTRAHAAAVGHARWPCTS